VTPVTGPAGTAIIFTEAISHGTLPWRGAGERRTVFLKYNPYAIAWSVRFYDRDGYPGLTPRQRRSSSHRMLGTEAARRTSVVAERSPEGR
jgi:hypothetical protein